MTTSPKVLFIAYNFPPHGGAGVQRSLKFVKYLPELGWQPLVVTTTANASLVQDSSLLNDIPSQTPIIRIPGFSISRLQTQAIKYHLGRAVVGLNVLLQLPDATRFWAHQARKTVGRLIEEEKPQLIYTTSGPYSSHLLGLWAREQFKIPWFADFRDPWSKNLLLPYLPGYRTINRQIERRVLATADRIACVSEPWLMDLQANLGCCTEKFMVLTNGYDDADIQPFPLTTTAQFTLTHIGSFYRNRRPDKIIAAIKQLIASNRIPASKLRVLFVGKNARQHIPFEPPFITHDYIPHKQLDQIRQQSDAFLLILATSPENIGNHSGKLFEYIASNRPILGIVPSGGVAQQLITETKTGIAISDETDMITQAIEKLYYQWESRRVSWDPDWDKIQQYTRRHLTTQLATTFNEMVTS